MDSGVCKVDTIKKNKIIELLSQGRRRGQACKEVGISRTTFYNHLNKDKEFNEAVSYAEMDANEAVENALYNKALEGNTTAIQVWLYNRSPERWSDKRRDTTDHSEKLDKLISAMETAVNG